MSVETVTASENVTIYVAGDISEAKRIIREYCWDFGLCVTVTPTTFIYTGGEEFGVAVGLVNYPRFPKPAGDVFAEALRLARVLRDGLFQRTALVVGMHTTEWLPRELSDQ